MSFLFLHQHIGGMYMIEEISGSKEHRKRENKNLLEEVP